MFDLAGDAVYVDAHVLSGGRSRRWLGLETVYELDRISGRYQALSDEQTASARCTRSPTEAVRCLRSGAELLDPAAVRGCRVRLATFIGATAQGATYECASPPRDCW